MLTFYAGWASTFGKPERGAEAADKAIRLNPSYLPWQAKPSAMPISWQGDTRMLCG